MQNSFWYMLLVFFSLLILGYTLWKRKDANLIVLYCFMSGLSYTIEFLIMILFKSYAYYPKILEEPYFDNVLGAITSNAFSVPMVSVFISAFRLSLPKCIIIAALFMGIETLFIYLNIFTHYWWRTAYTGFGFIFLFILAKKWLLVLHQSKNRLTHYITLFFNAFFINACLTFINACLTFIICGVYQLYLYKLQWFADPVRNHFVVNTIYELSQAAVFSYLVLNKSKYTKIIICILLFSVFDILLYKTNIMNILVSSNTIIFVLVNLKRILVSGILIFTNRYILNSN